MGSNCADLLRVANTHCAETRDDAFCVFLRIHHCICQRVEQEGYSGDIKQINAAFVSRCFTVYENFRQRRVAPADLSDNWIVAFTAYCGNTQAYLTVLPQMARAHILDDLPVVLFDTPVQKEDFDRVIDAISKCLHDALRKIDPTGRLLLEFGSRLAVPVLRELAWKKVEKRRALSERIKKLTEHSDPPLL